MFPARAGQGRSRPAGPHLEAALDAALESSFRVRLFTITIVVVFFLPGCNINI
jgi:hypothetical protein